MSIDKQSFQFIFENAFDSKAKSQQQRRQSNEIKVNNREKFDNRDDKTKVFIVEKYDNEKKEQIENHEKKQNEYYVVNDDLNYYNFNVKKKTFVNFTLVVIDISFSRCRRCKNIFQFNNDLHIHLRVDCHDFATTFKSKIETYFAIIIDIVDSFIRSNRVINIRNIRELTNFNTRTISNISIT